MPLNKKDDDPSNEGVAAGSSSNNENLSPGTRLLVSILSLFSAAASMYLWGAESAVDLLIHTQNETIPLLRAPSIPAPTPSSAEPVINLDASKQSLDSATGDRLLFETTAETITIKAEHKTQAPSAAPKPPYVGPCSDICTKRDAKRKQKYGGNLLEFSDVLRMAEAGHKKLQNKLRKDYGEHFDKIFVNGTNASRKPSYFGMRPPKGDGPSRERMKRKLKIKVLNMMASLKAKEKNVYGCNCIENTGTAKGNVDEEKMTELPEFYEKYVFANGGHSNSAGHGNIFKESYTAILGNDLRPVWEAIGIEMIDRNMGMGAMSSSPCVAACAKETFGNDVDFLAWNYAMTDRAPEHWLYYISRMEAGGGRPAHVVVEAGHARGMGSLVEEFGLTVFDLGVGSVESIQFIPDCQPDGIPLGTAKENEIPEFARDLRCNGRLEGKDLCFGKKWSCTTNMQAQGVQCTCPSVGKRSSWHMGYKMHALTGHFLALPLVEMLIEGIIELSAMDKDFETMKRELEAEEAQDHKKFLETPIRGHFERLRQVWDGTYGALGDDDLDYFFKGPSICRTALLPAMSRFLGLTTNTDLVGENACVGEETYDVGVRFDRNNGVYTYTTDKTPPPGEWSIMAPNDFRGGKCDAACPEIVMPDYKDWFMGNWSEGSASLTFPNPKEKRFYGYNPNTFKGILALVPTFFAEGTGKPTRFHDLKVEDFQAHVDLSVNGQPVTKYLIVDGMAILQGQSGIYWKPSSNNDYVLEFKPKGTIDGDRVIDRHMRLSGFLLM